MVEVMYPESLTDQDNDEHPHPKYCLPYIWENSVVISQLLTEAKSSKSVATN